MAVSQVPVVPVVLPQVPSEQHPAPVQFQSVDQQPRQQVVSEGCVFCGKGGHTSEECRTVVPPASVQRVLVADPASGSSRVPVASQVSVRPEVVSRDTPFQQAVRPPLPTQEQLFRRRRRPVVSQIPATEFIALPASASALSRGSQQSSHQSHEQRGLAGCSYCRDIGHVTEECSWYRGWCFCCGSRTHLAAACPIGDQSAVVAGSCLAPSGVGSRQQPGEQASVVASPRVPVSVQPTQPSQQSSFPIQTEQHQQQVQAVADRAPLAGQTSRPHPLPTQSELFQQQRPEQYRQAQQRQYQRYRQQRR